MNNDKIICFLHFHKSGGSSINELFKKYNKYKPNSNGNPWNKSNTKIIKFWNYNKDKFENFKNKLLSQKVNFVSLEWNFFKFYNEINLTNIELIVCIRDPYKRYISNMMVCNNHNMHSFNDETISWSRKRSNQKFKVNFNKYNYYTKMLNGFGDKPNIKINKTHLEIAKKILSKFSTIIILEDKETFRLLEKYNIYNIVHKHKNTKKQNTNVVCKFEEFYKYNIYDYELYNYAIKLSHSKLIKHNSSK